MRQSILVISVVLMAWQAVGRDAQTPDGPPPFAFEVAVIKPLDMTQVVPRNCPMPCPALRFVRERVDIEQARVELHSITLARLIQMAYRVDEERLTGPDWMDVDRFDVTATISTGVSKYRVPEMLQAMLADRFHLSVRRNTKTASVLHLVAGKSRMNLPQSTGTVDENERLYFPGVEGPIGHGRGILENNGTRHYEWSGISMADLAELLSARLSRPVIDKTGLQGRYQFSWTVPPPSPYPDDPTGRSARP